MELIPIVIKMELNGILLDKDKWLSLEKKAQERRIVLEDEIKRELLTIIPSNFSNALLLAEDICIPVKTKKLSRLLESITATDYINQWIYENLNLNSNKQMLTILQKYVDSKIENTNEKTLENFKQYPIITTLLEYRECNKKITTYGEEFLKDIRPEDGRIHCEFNQLGTASGRFSSSKPNLQNIPSEVEYRHCFVAPAGKLILSVDYSQQEYRLMGAMSGDEFIINAYKNGSDFHAISASIYYQKELKNVTKEERNFGKTLNFASGYGANKYGLAYNLKLTVDDAERYLDKVFEKLTTLSKFKEAFENQVCKKHFARTAFGRIRYWENKTLFTDGNEAYRYERKLKKEGYNHLIQGTGADITKLAMIKIDNENPFGDKLKIVLQEHDEIVCEVVEDITEEAREFVSYCMCQVFQPILGEIPAVVESVLAKEWSK
jgi:DNA polymerase-1